ncbi:MAG: hypothetical protein HKN91_11190 [Acidimicrobiia bacterium]|nr:hypothetical protein [Acidimicrobiia bacterium]
MDWYIEDAQQASELRRQFTSFLERHAQAGSDTDSAALTFSELVTNAFEHGGGSVWVSVDWTSQLPVLAVRDVGSSFDFASVGTAADHQERGRGLAIASSLARDLEVATRDSGGSTVTATLDVPRATSESIDPIARTVGALPAIEEAGEDGFGKESFLRALVVQFAQDLELKAGPDAAEHLVAQVGTDVGSRMEEEYRIATGAIGKLSPEQMAECFVRLKHAIDGDFYPLEVTAERIVLANRRCPFGKAVQKAPALCRMTSSVFGGIAANNADGADVLLEERIAVGDHQCRVTIRLGASHGSDDQSSSHVYEAPLDL